MSEEIVKCPHCLGEKPAAANVCMHCGRDKKGFGPRVRITSGARLGIGVFILLPLWIIGATILLLAAMAIARGITGSKTGSYPSAERSAYTLNIPSYDHVSGARFPDVHLES
jgi:hypothetical protein